MNLPASVGDAVGLSAAQRIEIAENCGTGPGSHLAQGRMRTQKARFEGSAMAHSAPSFCASSAVALRFWVSARDLAGGDSRVRTVTGWSVSFTQFKRAYPHPVGAHTARVEQASLLYCALRSSQFS